MFYHVLSYFIDCFTVMTVMGLFWLHILVSKDAEVGFQELQEAMQRLTSQNHKLRQDCTGTVLEGCQRGRS